MTLQVADIVLGAKRPFEPVVPGQVVLSSTTRVPGCTCGAIASQVSVM